ncbi:MAG: GIY-YIG nuclease family protein [bacterium]|nr:GIY-YIG nuclease family protein [bacterium]
MYYVYILLCKDGKPYTGCTSDLKDRIKRYELGRVTATKNRLPVKIISYFAFSDKYKAFDFEKYLKSGSGGSFLRKRLI